MAQLKRSIERRSEQVTRLEYLLYLPKGYRVRSQQQWPLILFLHGAGERGNDLEKVKVHGIPKIAGKMKLPFVCISPQCPSNHWWPEYGALLDALIDEAIAKYHADPSRIYLTGLSMGGYGTWYMALEYPHRFAAIAPICGGNMWQFNTHQRMDRIAHLPVWAFHGDKDRAVPIVEGRALYRALKKAGGNVRFTVYKGVGHDSWTQTYANPQLYDWFLAHQNTAG